MREYWCAEVKLLVFITSVTDGIGHAIQATLLPVSTGQNLDVTHGQAGPDTDNGSCICSDLNPVRQLPTSSVTATLKYFCNCPQCNRHRHSATEEVSLID
jgi:hypothetical protein